MMVALRTRTPDLLGVIRIWNRCDFNANAVPADLQRVSLPRPFANCTSS